MHLPGYLRIRILLIIVPAVVALVSCRRNSAQFEIPRSDNQDLVTALNARNLRDFNAARDSALIATMEQVGVASAPGDTRVYGVVMDWGVDSGIVSVIAFSNGRGLLITSNGLRIEHRDTDTILSAEIKAFVRSSNAYREPHAMLRAAAALPPADCASFTLLTTNGTFACDRCLSNVATSTLGVVTLFNEGNRLITRFRKTGGL